jgi:hypothetical protein
MEVQDDEGLTVGWFPVAVGRPETPTPAGTWRLAAEPVPGDPGAIARLSSDPPCCLRAADDPRCLGGGVTGG